MDQLPSVVFVLGGPGAGKGTQCARIVNDFGYVHLSAGDLLRAERAKGGELGDMINSYIKDGKIIPVEVTIRLIKAAMDASVSAGKNKFLIDGFPRNQDNMSGWESMMGKAVQFKFVLFLHCDEKVMEKRLLGRAEGRVDDNIESIRKRFNTYMESTTPIIDIYDKQGKVRKIDASPDADTVYEEVKALFAPAVHSTISDDITDQVKKNFNTVMSAKVRVVLAGDAEAGAAATDSKAKQFWELKPEQQEELIMNTVKETVFNPSEEQDDVLGVQWTYTGASRWTISGGYHVTAAETKSDGSVVQHACRVNSYGVLENYQTPAHPSPKEADPEDESGCVVC